MKMTKKRQGEISEYLRELKNFKQRVRRYEKQGFDVKKIDTFNKKELSNLKLEQIREETYSVSKAARSFNKRRYLSSWENTYRGDQQIISNFYKGVSAIGNGKDRDTEEFKELIRISNWMANQTIETQLKILYELTQRENQNIWNDIFGSDDPDIDLKDAWSDDLSEIAKKYGYTDSLRIDTDKLNTKWIDKYKSNESIKNENPNMFRTEMNKQGSRYEIPKYSKLEGIVASWDKSKSIFLRGF